ncbi:MAG: hypothetical protein QXO75_07620, partial [Nitrososphaerota archaeon]
KLTNFHEGRRLLKYYRKFSIEFMSFSFPIVSVFFHKRGYTFMELLDFGIISNKFAKMKDGNVFDETFVNSREDVDLSIEFSLTKERIAFINYRIGDYIGSSLGNGKQRLIRDVANLAYLNYKRKIVSKN